MKIVCKKYLFNTTDKDEINFLLPDADYSINATIDDMSVYIIKDSLKDIGITKPAVDAQTGGLYYEATNTGFNVSNVVDNGYMLEFFELATGAVNYKWQFDFYDDSNEFVHRGYAYKGDIKMSDFNQQELEIVVYAEEIEFKDAFSRGGLPSDVDAGFTRRFLLNGDDHFSGQNLISLLDVHLFPTVDISMGFGLTNYRVAGNPYFFYPQTEWKDDLIWIMSGYNSFRASGITPYEFLNGLCKAMGWKWYFYKGTLNIKELADEAPVIELDYNGVVLNSSLESNFLNIDADNIIMDNGSVSGGLQSSAYIKWGTLISPQYFNISGDRKITYGSGNRNYYHNDHHTAGAYELASEGLVHPFVYKAVYTGNPPSLNGFVNYVFLDDKYNMYRFEIVRENGEFEPLYGYYYTLPKNKTLVIEDVPVNGAGIGRVDFDNARTRTGTAYYNGNYLVDDGNSEPSSDYTLQFAGNIGNILYKQDANGKWVDYNYYITEDTRFQDNFATLLGNQFYRLYTITGMGKFTNPNQRIKLINLPDELKYEFEDLIFMIQDMNYNLEQGTFELKLLAR